MNTNKLRLLPSGILFAVAAAFAPLPAQAGYIYDLTVSDSWTGSGSITFDSLSGSTVDDVSAFSFHVSSGTGSPQDYDVADLAGVSWSIDALFDLTLLLSTSLVPFGANQSAILLTSDSSSHVDPCGLFVFGLPGSLSCIVLAGGGEVQFDGLLTARFVSVTAVPEPDTLALFGLGLAGLGLIWRRRPERRDTRSVAS